MKLPDELAAFSRHLMVFLVAVFAFSSKNIVDTRSSLAIGLLVCSMVLAFASFITGYSAFFHLFNDEQDRMAGRVPTREGWVTPAAVRRVRLQFFLTMVSLGLATFAILTSYLVLPAILPAK